MTNETKEMLEGWIDDLNSGTYPDEVFETSKITQSVFVDGMIFALEQVINSTLEVKA